MRSSAWHWVFSSKLKTTARDGGFKYRPTTSTSFDSNSGSVLSLKTSTRHGFSSWSAHICATVSLLTPTCAARVRVVQCVAPPGGCPVNVSSTTRCTVSAGSQDFRPRPLAIVPTPPMPFSANRFRHRRTASESTPQRRAISSFGTPSAAHSNAFACTTWRCGNTDEPAIRASSARWSSVTVNAAATINR